MNATRRDLIRLAGAGLAAEVLAVRPAAAGADRDRLLAELRSVFADHRSAEAIGRAYLHEHGGTFGLTVLMRNVMTRPRPAEVPLAMHVRQQISRDFAEGNVVLVDGWMLSSIEARLCAIVYLGAG